MNSGSHSEISPGIDWVYGTSYRGQGPRVAMWEPHLVPSTYNLPTWTPRGKPKPEAGFGTQARIQLRHSIFLPEKPSEKTFMLGFKCFLVPRILNPQAPKPLRPKPQTLDPKTKKPLNPKPLNFPEPQATPGL